jgi:hypothetical protein
VPLSIPHRNQLPPGIVPPSLPIDLVLYEAELPVVFLTRTLQDQPLLAYVADDTTEGVFTLLAPISSESIDALQKGLMPLRDVLTASWLWLHVSGGDRQGLWNVTPSEIPTECLPMAGVLVYPEHEPVFRARAVGQQVVLGQLPSSVVSFIADGTRKALKILLDHMFAIPVEGRPRQEHRALYDLPIQRFAFSSFELSFGPPEETLIPRNEVRAAALMLERGLRWASNGDAAPLAATSTDERDAILRAALLLTPPASGPIAEIHVSGTWVHSHKLRLTRESRRRVRYELRKVDLERIVRYEGRIGELDVDNLSFTLRDTEDGQDRRGYFADDLWDDMVSLLSDGSRVAVAGTERYGRLLASAVGPV